MVQKLASHYISGHEGIAFLRPQLVDFFRDELPICLIRSNVFPQKERLGEQTGRNAAIVLGVLEVNNVV